MTQVHYHAPELSFDRSWISPGALAVVSELQAAGFDGYLVGGCVRDLLMQRRPKDFDITTNANPEQVRRLFRRSRIIGRRFKLVHVRAGREVIEVATYRAKPDSNRTRRTARKAVADSGRVVDDNVFGTMEQDAYRRDFTLNSLYYDPQHEQVVDFLGGVKDARKSILRMVGDPAQRFTEDPVRMLRAVRFRAKLGVRLEDSLVRAMAPHLLEGVPPARLFDEVLKMFHYGHAVDSWREMRRHHLTTPLFPLTAALFEHADGAAAEQLVTMALHNTDTRVNEGKPVIPAFLFAVLLWYPFQREFAHRRQRKGAHTDAVWAAGETVFREQSRRVAVPRRVSEAVIEIWEMQWHLEQPQESTVGVLLAQRRFRAAYDFLVLRGRLGEVDEALGRWWTDVQEDPPAEDPPTLPPSESAPRKRRRRKRRGD